MTEPADSTDLTHCEALVREFFHHRELGLGCGIVRLAPHGLAEFEHAQ